MGKTKKAKTEFFVVIYEDKKNVTGYGIVQLESTKWNEADVQESFGIGSKIIAKGSYETCQTAELAWRTKQNAKKSVQKKCAAMDVAMKRAEWWLTAEQKHNDLAEIIVAKLTA